MPLTTEASTATLRPRSSGLGIALGGKITSHYKLSPAFLCFSTAAKLVFPLCSQQDVDITQNVCMLRREVGKVS